MAATWAVSTYILQDYRINLLKSETDSQKAIAEQYKSKSELLQREIDVVRAENAEYRAWLNKTKDAIPMMVPQLIELREKVAELEKRDSDNQNTPAVLAEPSTETRVYRGRAYIDQATGLVFTVLSVDVDQRANVAVKLPNKNATEEAKVYPGRQWEFESKGAVYVLTLSEVNFMGDSVMVQLVKRS
ncbi:hypothetical protein [Pseudomonas zeae]|uniref:Uncharacterized protein n=1 Tax=Pseudomonas zeae TaxID=2745510 RepID=A0A9E6T9E9_9PSED|nr:hypothetical protein [Pseudomonas zeae]QXI09578.1 hypothetical protein HU754_017195 [Pseudomonas zeae]